MPLSSVTNLARSAGLRWVRAVAYHHVHESSALSFERQLAHFRARFRAMDEADLQEFFSGSRVRAGKPGLLITFDDGLACHYRVAAPLLEKYGFRGLFFVPSDLPGIEESLQRAWCGEHDLFAGGEPGTRIGMSRDEIVDLRHRGHMIGCHTASHRRFGAYADGALIDREIVVARASLAGIIGYPPPSFAWVGGEPDTYDPAVQAALRRAGHSFSFTTQSGRILPGTDPMILHRTVLEPDMPHPLFLAKLHGLSDLTHAKTRRRLDTVLADAEDAP